jgi:hypothetical protein
MNPYSPDFLFGCDDSPSWRLKLTPAFLYCSCVWLLFQEPMLSIKSGLLKKKWNSHIGYLANAGSLMLMSLWWEDVGRGRGRQLKLGICKAVADAYAFVASYKTPKRGVVEHITPWWSSCWSREPSFSSSLLAEQISRRNMWILIGLDISYAATGTPYYTPSSISGSHPYELNSVQLRTST